MRLLPERLHHSSTYGTGQLTIIRSKIGVLTTYTAIDKMLSVKYITNMNYMKLNTSEKYDIYMLLLDCAVARMGQDMKLIEIGICPDCKSEDTEETFREHRVRFFCNKCKYDSGE